MVVDGEVATGALNTACMLSETKELKEFLRLWLIRLNIFFSNIACGGSADRNLQAIIIVFSSV